MIFIIEKNNYFKAMEFIIVYSFIIFKKFRNKFMIIINYIDYVMLLAIIIVIIKIKAIVTNLNYY